MAKQKVLETRKAQKSDEDFIWSIYKEAVRPLIEPKLKGAWDDAKERLNFRKIWVLENTHIIAVDGYDIGWLSGDESGSVVTIDHFYVRSSERGKGYGGRLIDELIGRWKGLGKSIELSMLKGVKARAFVDGRGFKVVADEGLTERLHLS